MMIAVVKKNVDTSVALNVSGSPVSASDSVKPLMSHQSRLILGIVESLSTRRQISGDRHFLLLKTAEGHLVRARWSEPPGLMPNLGDLIRIEVSAVSNGRFSFDTSTEPSHATAIVHPIQEHPWLDIRQWQAIQAPYALSVLERLYQATEQVEVLDRLWSLIHRVPAACLREWLFEVFADLSFSLPFIQVPASHYHHHSETGGLLQHSVECGEWVAQVAFGTLNVNEASLAIAADLLHDAGKIQTMHPSGMNPQVAHEVLTLTLLEPALMKLQPIWSPGAYALRQMLSWSSHFEPFPRLPGTLLVKMADQFSTALSARRMAFQAAPAHFYWAKLQTANRVQTFNRIN